MKLLEVRQKYSSARRIFNSVLSVSSGDETLRLLFDIFHKLSWLRGILASVEHHLIRSCYGKTIFKYSDFKKKKTRNALTAKQKQLKRHGLGNRPKATTALKDDEIEILFNEKVLGLTSPQALLNTVWLSNMAHFGLRGCKEQKELRRGDIVLKTDSLPG